MISAFRNLWKASQRKTLRFRAASISKKLTEISVLSKGTIFQKINKSFIENFCHEKYIFNEEILKKRDILLLFVSIKVNTASVSVHF